MLFRWNLNKLARRDRGVNIVILPQYTKYLPCYLQWLFALQSLLIGCQIPERRWSQACVGLLDA